VRVVDEADYMSALVEEGQKVIAVDNHARPP